MHLTAQDKSDLVGFLRTLQSPSRSNTSVQRLELRDGKSPATGADTAQGGAAIYRDGGSLTVFESCFHDGFAADLGAVVDFYDGRFAMHLSAAEKADLVASLRTL